MSQPSISWNELGSSPRNDVALIGSNSNEQLSTAEPIGDMSGDGHVDWLVRGLNRSFVVFGPMQPNVSGSVAEFANIIINHSVLGVPARALGDINGDGRTDLVLVSNPNTTEVRVIFGGTITPIHVNQIRPMSRERLLLRPLYVKLTLSNSMVPMSMANDTGMLRWFQPR